MYNRTDRIPGGGAIYQDDPDHMLYMCTFDPLPPLPRKLLGRENDCYTTWEEEEKKFFFSSEMARTTFSVDKLV